VRGPEPGLAGSGGKENGRGPARVLQQGSAAGWALLFKRFGTFYKTKTGNFTWGSGAAHQREKKKRDGGGQKRG